MSPVHFPYGPSKLCRGTHVTSFTKLRNEKLGDLGGQSICPSVKLCKFKRKCCGVASCYTIVSSFCSVKPKRTLQLLWRGRRPPFWLLYQNTARRQTRGYVTYVIHPSTPTYSKRSSFQDCRPIRCINFLSLLCVLDAPAVSSSLVWSVNNIWWSPLF
jgi:hypothetical protein